MPDSSVVLDLTSALRIRGDTGANVTATANKAKRDIRLHFSAAFARAGAGRKRDRLNEGAR
jgi:hypothetical protein